MFSTYLHVLSMPTLSTAVLQVVRQRWLEADGILASIVIDKFAVVYTQYRSGVHGPTHTPHQHISHYTLSVTRSTLLESTEDLVGIRAFRDKLVELSLPVWRLRKPLEGFREYATRLETKTVQFASSKSVPQGGMLDLGQVNVGTPL